MIVELHGAGFVNKGAELMLRTAVRQLSARVSGFRGAVLPADTHFEERVHLGLLHVAPSPGRYDSLVNAAGNVERLLALGGGSRYAKLLAWYGLVDVGRVDALVDIAGFQYSDAWDPRYAERFAQLTSHYRRRGAPIILLPQALGPFRRSRVRAAFERISDNADLIFARDEESYGHALEVTRRRERLHVAPDITLFDGFTRGADGLAEKPYCCLVPNARVMDRAGRVWGETYLACMAAAARASRSAGVVPKLLLHTSEPADLELARRISNEEGAQGVECVIREDPFEIKEIISGAQAVVGSRFHGLVSALSQGVPSIALGWSHKYTALFSDFGISEYAFDSSVTPENVAESVAKILDPRENGGMRARLTSRLAELSEVNEKMWTMVSTVLRCRA